jgi:pyridoxine kinase
MGTILAISSQVARGHVGLRAIVPALQALGHDVIMLPTVMLSNHPGHGAVAGQRIDPALLRQMLATLDGHGWLGSVDAVLSGYLPSAEHVAVAAEAVSLVRRHRPSATYFCDPVLGDDPKGLYIAEEAARGIAERLVPIADVIFPNRFELSWLAGQDVGGIADARAAAARFTTVATVATSIPAAAGQLATVAVSKGDAWATDVARQEKVPNGTGDLLAALIAGRMVNGRTIPDAVGSSVDDVQKAICASSGRDELDLVAILKGFGNEVSRPASPLR